MKLHNYQQRAVDFIEAHPRCILSVGMGLGKTAAVLNYIEKLRPKNCLIVAPKRVAETVWKQEAEKWGLLTVALSMVVVNGTPKQRKAAWEDNEHPYKVVGRDNLADLFDSNDYQPTCNFDLVVLDELTSFKSVDSKRTRRVFALARSASRCVGLTGTFLANGAIDIFAQCASVGLASNLKEFYSWRARYFKDVMAGSGMAWHKWRLVVPLEDVLHRWHSDIFTLDSKDYLDIPPVSVVAHPVELSKDERERYDNLEAFLCADLDSAQVSVDDDAKFMKMQTMADGFVYVGEDYTEGNGFYANVVRGKSSSKLEAVADFCEQCVGESEPVLLFYAFREECAWLREMLGGKGIETMEVREKGAIDKWNAGGFEGVLMAHPASAGHGLNLQSGGRILVWSTLTYNYEYYAQANARLARQGQRKAVQIHIFTAAKTVEDGKQKALERKDNEQGQFLAMTKQ